MVTLGGYVWFGVWFDCGFSGLISGFPLVVCCACRVLLVVVLRLGWFLVLDADFGFGCDLRFSGLGI